MAALKKMFIIFLSIVTFQSCLNPNDKIYSKLENDIEDSIKKYDASKFDYSYITLNPQTSYFTNSQLKFLTLKSNGELCDAEEKYIFDTGNDSIILLIERTICYSDDTRWKKTWDTIYVKNYLKGTEEKFSDGKSVANHKLENFDNRKFINEVIKETEKKYNSHR